VDGSIRRVDGLGGKEATLSVSTITRLLEELARRPKLGTSEIESAALAVCAPGLKTALLAHHALVARGLAGADVSSKAPLLQRLDATARDNACEKRQENGE